MTRAPANLLAVRNLLLTYLNVDKNTVRAADLEPAEVGIVGDADHRGGYHCGSDRVVTNDYSVVESTRDSAGLTLDASALDVGEFTVASGGKVHNLCTFSTWCVAQCEAGAADTRDIREIIYSPDGKTVRRWDRLGRRTTGDSSHLFHTHFSFFRDATKAGRDLTPLFRRYLTTIGLLEDEMDAKGFLAILRDPAVAAELARLPWAFKPVDHGGETTAHAIVLNGHTATLGALRADLAGLAGREPATAQEIAAEMLRVLTPQAIADVIPAGLARDVADELARRMVA